jgi:hypothetical protein
VSLASIVQSCRDVPDDLFTEWTEADEAKDNKEALAIVLAAIRDHRDQMMNLYKEVERRLVEISGRDSYEVPGLGLIEVKTENSYTNWQNEDLTKVLVAMALDERIVNHETGEYEREAEAVARVLMECARPSWRLTPLRARNIPIDEYSEVNRKGLQVRLPPMKKGR